MIVRTHELTYDEAREICRLYREEKPRPTQKQLAYQFAVSVNVVNQILRGRRYSEATGITPRHSPECRDCTRDFRQDNLDAARAQTVEVSCYVCHGSTTRSVDGVLYARGAVRCEDCIRAHRDVGTAQHQSTCRNCNVRKDNITAARAAMVSVSCHICHGPATKSVGTVLNQRGAVRCWTCDGRH
jgi:hypothetical protein